MSRALLVGLLVACGPPARQDMPSDGGMSWEDARPDAPWYPGELHAGFHLPGLSGYWDVDPSSSGPRIETSPDGLIVGGSYEQAGTAKRPALWNGTNWVALPPTDAYRIAVAADGTVYAASRPTYCDLCGPASVKRLVQGQWESLPGDFFSITEMTATSLGLIIVGDGAVRRFDGTNWIDLTPVAPVTEIDAVAERNGVLCVGGRFTAIGTTAANNVACLGPTGWAQAGGGLDGTVHALAFASDGRLLAGGTFQLAGGANLAALTQTGWAAVGGGVAGVDADVNSIAVDGDDIIVGGRFDTPVTNLGRFSQGAWSSPTGEWRAAKSRPIVTDVAVASGAVYFVGRFDRIGGIVASNIARWTTTIEPVLSAGDAPLGIAGDVNALLREPDGSVIAGGQFVGAGTISADNVARFVNGGWEAFGSIADPVTALARTDTVYAGTATGTLLRWTGTSWTPIATLNGRIQTLFAFNDELIVGGDFTTPDRILRWNGSQLERIGFAPPWDVRVLGTSRGRLCAGVFVPYNTTDPQNRPLWCWDGMYWVPEPLPGWLVTSIATLEDDTAIVAGDLRVGSASAGIAVNRDGLVWLPVAARPSVQLLLPYGGGVFLGDSQHLRWWDAHTDEPLSELVYGGVRALALLPQGLLIGGNDSLSRSGAPPYSFGVAAFDL